MHAAGPRCAGEHAQRDGGCEFYIYWDINSAPSRGERYLLSKPSDPCEAGLLMTEDERSAEWR